MSRPPFSDQRIPYVVFDVDGVVITQCHRPSEIAIERFSLSAEVVRIFFKTKWLECLEGKASFDELLATELPKWGFSGSVQEFLSFWLHIGRLDHSVLDLAIRLRGKGIRCYLGSNQEKIRGEYLWNDCKLKESFDGFFFSCFLGVLKPSSQFFQRIQKLLHTDPGTLVLVDDAEDNVQNARRFGWSSVLWPSEAYMMQKLVGT